MNTGGQTITVLKLHSSTTLYTFPELLEPSLYNLDSEGPSKGLPIPAAQTPKRCIRRYPCCEGSNIESPLDGPPPLSSIPRHPMAKPPKGRQAAEELPSAIFEHPSLSL